LGWFRLTIYLVGLAIMALLAADSWGLIRLNIRLFISFFVDHWILAILLLVALLILDGALNSRS